MEKTILWLAGIEIIILIPLAIFINILHKKYKNKNAFIKVPLIVFGLVFLCALLLSGELKATGEGKFTYLLANTMFLFTVIFSVLMLILTFIPACAVIIQKTNNKNAAIAQEKLQQEKSEEVMRNYKLQVEMEKNMEIEKIKKENEINKLKQSFGMATCAYCQKQYEANLTACPSCGGRNEQN